MKEVCLIVNALILTTLSVTAAVKNGYSPAIEEARKSLTYLNEIYNSGSLGMKEASSVKERMNRLTEFIRSYEITEKALQQFREVAGELYASVDTLKDEKGRSVDVYVKIVGSLTNSIYGITNLDHSPDDPHAYISEFGPNTVSVKILEGSWSLKILAHELGHVYYQVPNLAAYKKYYEQQYLEYKNTSGSYGHYTGDLSGASAREFERMFSSQSKRRR